MLVFRFRCGKAFPADCVPEGDGVTLHIPDRITGRFTPAELEQIFCRFIRKLQVMGSFNEKTTTPTTQIEISRPAKSKSKKN